jgi:hypothetical protein
VLAVKVEAGGCAGDFLGEGGEGFFEEGWGGVFALFVEREENVRKWTVSSCGV